MTTRYQNRFRTAYAAGGRPEYDVCSWCDQEAGHCECLGCATCGCSVTEGPRLGRWGNLYCSVACADRDVNAAEDVIDAAQDAGLLDSEAIAAGSLGADLRLAISLVEQHRPESCLAGFAELVRAGGLPEAWAKRGRA